VNDFMADNNLKRNEVVDLIHKSGECLCGAFAKPGELKRLDRDDQAFAECIKCGIVKDVDDHPLHGTICHLCGRRMFERDAKSD